MNDPRLRWVLAAWPYLALGILAVVFVLMLVFSRKAPVITSLEPPMAGPGQQVAVIGEYFGRTEREGSLSLAGEIPPPSLIQSWSDQRIVFVVPEDASSGLVTISNTQGTSTGVLFTNTQSIPTVLQTAGLPGQPLAWALVPALAAAGQNVTVQGRNFGAGDEASAVLVATGPDGPTLELSPDQTVSWTNRSVTFPVPAGTGGGATVQVRTPRGLSPALALVASGPVAYHNPQTLHWAFHIIASAAASQAVVLWAPVPGRNTPTAWTMDGAVPSPVAATSPPAFLFPAGAAGPRDVTYHLTLTSWAQVWNGFAAGTVPSGDAPPGDPVPAAFWKPSLPALKALTAKWGLDTPDPWLRIQRIQTGLAAAWTSLSSVPGTERTPVQILGSKQADSAEISTLALALASSGGIPGRLVRGIVARTDGQAQPRTWAQVWLAGAGWVSWDVLDGNPGTLDNRHFALVVGTPVPGRLLAKSRTFGPGSGWAGTLAAGEVAGPGADPEAAWQITFSAK